MQQKKIKLNIRYKVNSIVKLTLDCRRFLNSDCKNFGRFVSANEQQHQNSATVKLFQRKLCLLGVILCIKFNGVIYRLDDK